MATAEPARDEVFLPGGQLCKECISEPAMLVLREALKSARDTRWDSVRSPHIFMGLLAVPDPGVRVWGDRIGADLNRFFSNRDNIAILPVTPLGAHFRTLFKTRLQTAHPELFALVPSKVWQRHWNVDSRPAGSGENALRYLSRYVFKTATSNRVVWQLPDGRLRWDYRESKNGKLVSIKLAPLEFMGRFLQHILPRGFTRVRTFGWLHPAAKVRGNRVRALLNQHPVLTPAEKQTWQPPPDPDDLEKPPPQNIPAGLVPLCPRCQKAMQLVGSWHPTRPMLYPKRPP